MDHLVNLFTSTETPFMLLFVVLFIFVIRENKGREEYHRQALKEQLESLDHSIKTLLQVWKTLLDAEAERRKEK